MRSTTWVMLLNAGILSGFCATSAFARNWVRVVDNPGGNATFFNVDLDSIVKDGSGFIHYDEETDWGTESNAIDCQNMINYSTKILCPAELMTGRRPAGKSSREV